MSPTGTIQELIASVGEQLTPTERRIAEVVLAEPTLLAFGTVSDLAGRVDTSRPSVVRFATKLGFEGYTELQRWSREGVSKQLSRPSERIRSGRAGEAGSLQSAVNQAVARTFEQFDRASLARFAEPIASARTVWIVSGETSRAGARTLMSGLGMVLQDVRMVEEHTLGRCLSIAGAGDVCVAFDFARYRRASVAAAEALGKLALPVLAITDGPLSPLVPHAHAWCGLEVPAVGPFDSSVPAVLAAELLVQAVVDRLGDEAQARIDRLEDAWTQADTFLPE